MDPVSEMSRVLLYLSFPHTDIVMKEGPIYFVIIKICKNIIEKCKQGIENNSIIFLVSVIT